MIENTGGKHQEMQTARGKADLRMQPSEPSKVLT